MSAGDLLPRMTKLYSFPNAQTEIATELTIRMQNILHSPTVARYDVIYKLYRRQSEKLMTIQFSNSANMYCYSGSAVYEVGPDLELMLLKLKLWKLRQTMKITGSMHELDRTGPNSSGKCQICVGVISPGPSTKGIILDLQEAQSQVPGEGHMDEQVLRDVMGSKFDSLMVQNNPAASVVLSTGATLSTQAAEQSGKIQTAAAYFEMFSKL